MQVLYQLSYGPIDAVDSPDSGGPVGFETPASALRKLTPQRVETPHTWRQTATSLPWTVTCSASTRIGA